MVQNKNNRSQQSNGGFLSPLGCGTTVFVVMLVGMLITTSVKSCNEKKKHENNPWYQKEQAERQKYEDSLKRLNELAKTNPDEYNRIIRQDKMWKYTSSKGDAPQNNDLRATIKSKYDGYIDLPEPIKHKDKAPRTKYLGKSVLTIEHTKDQGNRVIIMIPYINQYYNSDKQYISVSFDNKGNSIKYDYYLSGSNIVLENSDDFIELCRLSTYIRFSITVTIYNHNDDVEFEFEVPEPLVWKY